MFDKTSEVFKEQLIKELIVFENAAEYKEDNKLSYHPAGVVKYTTPDISGEIELVITEDPQLDTGGCSLCKFTDNTNA